MEFVTQHDGHVHTVLDPLKRVLVPIERDFEGGVTFSTSDGQPYVRRASGQIITIPKPRGKSERRSFKAFRRRMKALEGRRGKVA